MTEIISNLWGVLAQYLGYHLSSFGDLPPVLADRYHAAQSVCESMFGEVEESSSLAPTVRPFVGAFFIAKDRTGQKATDAGYADLPESLTIGEYGVRWETLGGPFVFPLPSTTSARVAVCIAVPTTMDDDTGYARVYPSTMTAHDGMQFFVLNRYGDMAEANAAIVDLRNALRTLDAASREDARRRERFGDDGKDGAAF